MQKRLTLLGSTGSIGDSTLDVVARHPERFSVYALSAHRNGDKLVEQCLRFKPEVAVVGDADTDRFGEPDESMVNDAGTACGTGSPASARISSKPSSRHRAHSASSRTAARS